MFFIFILAFVLENNVSCIVKKKVKQYCYIFNLIDFQILPFKTYFIVFRLFYIMLVLACRLKLFGTI